MSQSDDDGPVVGLTGARFGGAGRRKRSGAPRPVPEGTDVSPPSEMPAPADRDGPVVGRTGARFGGAAARRVSGAEPVEPQGAAPPDPEPQATVEPAPRAVVPEPETEPVGTRVAVRPYVLTGGRTRARVELAIESLVSVSRGARMPESPDHRAVVALCAGPRSVAEIAALMRLPLGVAKVLVGDLAAAGTVAVHASAGPAGPDLVLMERVLAGLRRL